MTSLEPGAGTENKARAELPAPDDCNGWADFWFYEIGVNVIPAIGPKKTIPAGFSWTPYQSVDITVEQHEKMKVDGIFKEGLAIIMGKIWRGRYAGWYLTCVDLDNQLAIKKFDLKDGATLTERRGDRIHFYLISKTPISDKTSDKSSRGDEINAEKIPAFEIKGSGSWLIFCTPNANQNGVRYQLEGREPFVLDDRQRDQFVNKVSNICKGFGGRYPPESGSSGLIPMAELSKEDTIIYEGQNKHLALLRKMESYIKLNPNTPLDEIKEWSILWNQKHCRSPLDDREFEKQWQDATNWPPVKRRRGNNEQEQGEEQQIPEEKGASLDDDQIQQIRRVIWRSGEENISTIVDSICSFLHRYGYSRATAIDLVTSMFSNEVDRRYGITRVEEMYRGEGMDVESLLSTLKRISDIKTAGETISQIVQILIGGQKHITCFIDAMLCENTFVTMKDTEELFYYDGGIYVDNGEWKIRQKLEILCPTIRTFEIQEIISKIKNRTGRDRPEFDGHLTVTLSNTMRPGLSQARS